ncbi:malto-oligosyltrehalose trehalohydrolase [Pseudochryseolinea flava]|uniref:Malto-oligosyltrehalose trehalohydrolase n=1 Tax=Pseudochryseolinea flava TaxID=2059302 RepID=A0A364Y2K6_9BACT|nr:malto-oligosyltrehalose trehalohydrolase [Pseudochryseolinea flava]RAW00929.1 malto-oligosyltrehalose trehalohydrolase [Pseudochryseolinea flava]
MNYLFGAFGATYQKNGQCTFRTWAPERKSVKLKLLKDGRHFDMKRDEFGFWETAIDFAAPGDEYQFVLDDDKLLPDPASRCQKHGVHGPSVVTQQSFSWNDSRWKGIPLEEMVIYELHIGTFTKQGTFEGVVSKLDYLSELGINTIEIMPLAQFPGSRNWGYDGVFPFAVQHTYGGIEGLKQLVDAAHQRNIAVILDVVYNHQGPEGNYFEAFGPFFSDKYKTFWGKAINFDDAHCDAVRHFYLQNALQWLDEFHIDGLRLDAVHAIWDFSAQHFVQQLADTVKDLDHKLGCKKVLIAEFDLNNPRYIRPKTKGGLGLDGQWIDEFHHALHARLTGEMNGYYEDFGDTTHLTKSLRDSYVYTGEYSKHRKKYFGIPANDTSYGQFVVFSQNHDQIGNRLLGDRISKQVDFEKLKLAAATVLLSPHVPMLFMGEEYGEQNPFQYFISHTDKTLIENVRKGRREEFKYFGWTEEVPDPQAVETFEQCILSWDLQTQANRTLFSLYQYLINFRKIHPAMKSRERSDLMVHNLTEKDLIVFERYHDGHRILIVLNFSDRNMIHPLQLERQLKKIFDSASWSGSEQNPTIVNTNEPIAVKAWSAQVYER